MASPSDRGKKHSRRKTDAEGASFLHNASSLLNLDPKGTIKRRFGHKKPRSYARVVIIHLPGDRRTQSLFNGTIKLKDLLNQICIKRGIDTSKFVPTDLNGKVLDDNATMEQLGIRELAFTRPKSADNSRDHSKSEGDTEDSNDEVVSANGFSLDQVSKNKAEIASRLEEHGRNPSSLNLGVCYLKKLPQAVVDYASPQITMLILSENSFHKMPRLTSRFQNLTDLDVSNNKIRTFSSEISKCQNLNVLRANRNRIRQISPKISRLKQLRQLDLSFNKLTEVSPAIFLLPQLEFLSLKSNPIKSIPEAISQCKKLCLLNLAHCELSDLPAALCSVTSLMQLNLSNNQLLCLPAKIGNMRNLSALKIDHNNLAALPVSIGGCRGLGAGIDIAHNPLRDAQLKKARDTSAQALWSYLEERYRANGGDPGPGRREDTPEPKLKRKERIDKKEVRPLPKTPLDPRLLAYKRVLNAWLEEIEGRMKVLKESIAESDNIKEIAPHAKKLRTIHFEILRKSK